MLFKYFLDHSDGLMEKTVERQRHKEQQNQLGGCCTYPGRDVSGVGQGGDGWHGET